MASDLFSSFPCDSKWPVSYDEDCSSPYHCHELVLQHQQQQEQLFYEPEPERLTDRERFFGKREPETESQLAERERQLSLALQVDLLFALERAHQRDLERERELERESKLPIPKPKRPILYAIGVLTVTVSLTIFLSWEILRPSKPSFILQDVTLNSFDLSSGGSAAPKRLSINLQVRISSRNPNSKIGIYYQKVNIYVSYRNQIISNATLLPSTYLGHEDNTAWSSFLCGNSVPLSPYAASALCEDLNAGMVSVNIKADARIKWKVGKWVSGRFHLHVKCPAYITFGDKSKGVATPTSGAAIKLQSCSVDV